MISQRVKNLYWGTAGRVSGLNLLLQRWRYRFSGGRDLRVHLGCGHRYVEGFVNVEGNLRLKKDLWLDFSRGLPFREGQVALVYASHVLEHFSFVRAKRLLQECRRVLRPGGGIRIVVPSLEKAISAFLRGDRDWFSGWPDDYRSLGGRLNNYLLCRDQHRLMFDLSFLEELLSDSGFDRILQRQPRQSGLLEPKELERLEPESSRDFFETSLIVEACRPSS